MRQIFTSLFVLPLLGAPAVAQPYLVKDINPLTENGSSTPAGFVRFGKYAFFASSTLREGREPWVSDGTQAGTFLLEDTCPNECSGDPLVLAVTPRGVFFSIRDAQDTRYLWVTQGTPASTIQLATVTAGGNPVWVEGQGVLYFHGTETGHGAELWRTNGTPAGTFRVAEIWPGPGSQLGEPVLFKGRLFFSANDGVSGTALWTSDGTAAGTRVVKDTSASTSVTDGPLRHLRAASNFLFFQAPGPAGWELWKSDGTTKGTRLVADLVPGPNSSSILGAIAVGSRLFLEVEVDPLRGQELWVSDGTRGGTRKLTDFIHDRPFSPSSLGTPLRALASAAVLGNRLFFPANETTLGREIWVTDGTIKGTRPLIDLCPGPCLGALSLWPAQQNRIFFTASDGTRGLELWTSDGTNTHIVRDICRKECSSWPRDPIFLGGQLVFTAEDGPTGRQIWRTNGTAAGTLRLSTVPAGNFEIGNASDFQATATADRLFFSADDGVHGKELWVSDGTPGGTRLLADLDSADHGGSAPDTFMSAGGTLFFFADDGEHGEELWKSDGTAAGTTLVHEFSPGPQALARSVRYAPGVESGGVLYALLELGGSHRALWRSGGTDAGTLRLTPEDVEVAQGGGHGGGPVLAGGKIFFTATDGLHGRELWVTDGSPAGTHLVADLMPGPSGSDPFALTAFQGKLFFSAASSSPSLRALWSTDGTEGGTDSISEAQNPKSLTVHQGLLYFIAGNLAQGVELWRTDGTAAGTLLLPDALPSLGFFDVGPMASLGTRLLFWIQGFSPALWTLDGTAAGTQKIGSVSRLFWLTPPPVLDGSLYFFGTDSSGPSLWRTDGTAAGTFPLRDKNGQILREPAIMTVFDGRLYFITSDIGATLWQSDGTPQGTVSIRQLEPGQQTSLALGVAGSRLFFRNFDPASGLELWAIDKAVE